MTTAAPLASNARFASRLRWWICLLLFSATALNYMDRMALNQMALRIQHSLNLDDVQYSRLESGFSLAFAMGTLITGTIVDKVSVRWVYPVLVLGWSAAGIMTGYANGFVWLFLCRVALGLFEAGNWPCGVRTTRIIMKPEERSIGNSLFQSGTAVGAVVTPVLVLILLRSADPGESQRNAIMAVTGGTYAAVVDAPTDTWKYPFLAIGLIGLVWVAMWVLTVPGRVLDHASGPGYASAAGAVHFWHIFRDRRYWAALAVSIAINVTWHTYRIWLPKFLQEKRGFSEVEMTSFTTWFYLTADIGSWTIGLLTLFLLRRGMAVYTTRLLMLGGCAGLALIALAIPFAPVGWQMTAVIMMYAFAALGLFPTYYSLSQEVSGAHQGKVTGTLGAFAHLFLSLILYPIQGWAIKEHGYYDEVFAIAGIFPLLGLGIMLWLWPRKE